MPDIEVSTSPSRTAPSWMAPAALVLAVIAVAVALWSAFGAPVAPTTDATGFTATGAPSAEEEAQAKTDICAAFSSVRDSVSLQTNTDLGPDPAAVSAVAANSRLATLGGGQYLLSKLNPTVPTDLAEAVRSFAFDLQDIGVQQLAGIGGDDPKQLDRMNAAQADAVRITDLCR